jgi:hypothetical protein
MKACGRSHGGVEAQNGPEEGRRTSSRRFAQFDEEKDPDPDPHFGASISATITLPMIKFLFTNILTAGYTMMDIMGLLGNSFAYI